VNALRDPAARHRALVRRAGGVAVERLPTPEPGPGEVLLAPVLAGLCGTDLQMLRGLREDPAPVIGHEGVARVVATGGDTPRELTAGTLVTVNPTHPTDPSFLLGHNVDGFLQERTLVPATAVGAGLVQPVPPLPDTALFALLEPLAAVRYSLELLAPAAPANLLVYGDGVIGHLAVRAAPHRLPSVARTVLVHHTRAGLAWSRSQPFPADVLLGPDPDGAAVRAALGDGRTAVILATPRNATLACLEAALRHLPEGTVADLFGGLPPGARTPLLPGTDLAAVRSANQGGHPYPGRTATTDTALGTRVGLTGHRGVANRHLLDAVAELRDAPGRYRGLVTHTTDLDGAALVMNRLREDTGRTERGRRLVKLAVRVVPSSEPSLETS
jgi:threonine dehydrogenase-like Zn-dependent dehydrogenase